MSALAFQALRLLADGRFRSGEDIARGLGRSRAALNEALKVAPLLGVDLFRVRGKGYRLAAPIEFLEAPVIVAALGSCASRVRLILLDEIDSTSTRLSALAAEGAPTGTCVAVEWQRAGRGRRGRAWQSGLGSGLAFSLLWRFERGAGHLAGLSLAVAVALARALEEAGATGVGVKWPNDLVVDDRKLAGILVETTGEMLGPTAAVIGVGVNYRLPEALVARIDQPVTDVASACASLPSRNTLLGSMVRELVGELDAFERSGFAASREAWRARHPYAGRRVRVSPSNEAAYDADVIDIADDGALLVAAAGGTQRLTSAEVSVRL
jgi:BirA family transcriptional regulator, biotin operon repressor / biotin---[acetyl-CoA-carboxylase] ligase